MKQNVMLTIACLLSILLLTLHITDDIVRGISKAEPSNIALAVLVVLLYGTLVLVERRSGYVIMLLVGLFAAGMPVIHMRGAHYGEIAKSTGGFFFVWTLWALGGLGGVTLILSARGACDGASRGSPHALTSAASHFRYGSDVHSSESAKQEGLEVARVSKAFANDVLLALSCREAGCLLVTDNERDYRRIRRFVPFDFIKPWPGGLSSITLPSGS